MMRYDMNLIGKKLGLMERFFLTREKGEQAYQLLVTALQETPKGQPMVLVFPPGQLLDSSFADEVIIRLGEEIIAGAFGDRCLLLEGISKDSINNIKAAISLRRLKLAFLAVDSTGNWQCIGKLEPSLLETLNIVARKQCLTAPELGEIKKLAINSASNRLRRLYDHHLVRREYEVSDKGLQYLYFFWQWTEKQPYR